MRPRLDHAWCGRKESAASRPQANRKSSVPDPVRTPWSRGACRPIRPPASPRARRAARAGRGQARRQSGAADESGQRSLNPPPTNHQMVTDITACWPESPRRPQRRRRRAGRPRRRRAPHGVDPCRHAGARPPAERSAGPMIWAGDLIARSPTAGHIVSAEDIRPGAARGLPEPAGRRRREQNQNDRGVDRPDELDARTLSGRGEALWSGGHDSGRIRPWLAPVKEHRC